MKFDCHCFEMVLEWHCSNPLALFKIYCSHCTSSYLPTEFFKIIHQLNFCGIFLCIGKAKFSRPWTAVLSYLQFSAVHFWLIFKKLTVGIFSSKILIYLKSFLLNPFPFKAFWKRITSKFGLFFFSYGIFLCFLTSNKRMQEFSQMFFFAITLASHNFS